MDLKIKDVSELLNVSETTIRRWLTDKKIPAYRINGQYRFNRAEIEDWVMQHKLESSLSPVQDKNEEPLQQGQGGIKQYSLFRAIHKGGILYNIPGNTKEEVIRASMKVIANRLNVDADVLSELLLERERLQSTGLGHGIGLPHTRDYLLNTHRDAVFIVFPEKQIQYEAIDHKPVHTLFFLFACDDKRHLHLLAKIAHLSSLEETIHLLQKRPNKDAVLDYLKNWEGSIQRAQEELVK